MTSHITNRALFFDHFRTNHLPSLRSRILQVVSRVTTHHWLMTLGKFEIEILAKRRFETYETFFALYADMISQ
jgi:hypothetical protein